ncbi:MAG: hypothetical protein ACYSX1_12585, partial [Planctomycetota bacterium]
SVGRVFCLQRRSIQLGTGVVQTQITYGLTSLPSDEASPTDLLTFMRDYWGIENGLHYRRDRTLLEDATRLNFPSLAQTIAVINNFIVGLMYQLGFRNLPSARGEWPQPFSSSGRSGRPPLCRLFRGYARPPLLRWTMRM